MSVNPHHANRDHEIQLDPAQPHFDFRFLQRRPSEQGRFRVQFLKIATDRNRFRDTCPILQLEDWNGPNRILGQEFRRFLLALDDIRMHQRDINSFLGQKNANAAGVWPSLVVVEFHIWLTRSA